MNYNVVAVRPVVARKPLPDFVTAKHLVAAEKRLADANRAFARAALAVDQADAELVALQTEYYRRIREG